MQWLLVPLSDGDVLVAGERVLYRSRRHWLAVMPEIAQFLAVALLYLTVLAGGIVGPAAVLVCAVVVVVAVVGPLVRRNRWRERLPLAMIGLGVVGLTAGLSPAGMGALIVIAMATRAAVRVLRWSSFQRTYLTNRRIMEVDGFLGTKVNSMPLSKVTDIMLHRSAAGEILGYGTFRVESAGQHQALGRLDYLLEPERFHQLVVESSGYFT